MNSAAIVPTSGETTSLPAEAPTHAFKYQAFISYRRQTDTVAATEVLRALETYAIPPAIQRQFGTGKRCGRLFMDTAELSAASSLPEALRAALDDSRYLIVVCSPGAVDRPWIDQEIQRFLDTGRKTEVLAVLVEGQPEQSFPAPLRALNPLAVDVRGRSPRERRRLLRTERLRLLAPIIGCDFDTLRHRDGDRARARLRWMALGASVAAVSALLVVVYVLRLRADSERRRILAESRLATASQTVDQINHVIQDQMKRDTDLETVKKELLEVVGETQRALSASGADGRDERLIDMMTHFHRGDIARAHHDTAGAAREYRTALQISGPALQKNPKDVPIRQDVALMHERLGTIAQETGDLVAVKAELEAAIRINEEILKDAPANVGVRDNLAKEYVQHGLQKEHDGQDGITDYTRAIEVVPDAVDAKGAVLFDNLVPLAWAYRERGRALAERDELEKGIADLRKARDLSEKAIEAFPANYPAMSLVGDYIQLGRAEEAAERLADAVTDLQAGLRYVKHWRSQNPQSVVVIDDEWQLRAMVVRNLARLHRPDALASELEAFLAVDAERLGRLEHTATGIEKHLAGSLELAVTLKALGEIGAAQKVAGRALQAVSRSFDGEKSRLRESRLLVGVLPTLATVIGTGPFLPEFERAAEACRGTAETADRDGALRCGYRAMTFGRLAMALGLQSMARRASSISERFSARFQDDRGLDAQRFRATALYLSVLVATSDKTPDKARATSAALVDLNRTLIAASAAEQDQQNDLDRALDPLLLADALLISVGLTDLKQIGDVEIGRLREVITLLTPLEDAMGTTILDRAAAIMMLARVEMSRGDLAAARRDADALDAILRHPMVGNLGFGPLFVSAAVFDTELAAKMRDTRSCGSALKNLEALVATTPDLHGASPVLDVARRNCVEAGQPN